MAHFFKNSLNQEQEHLEIRLPTLYCRPVFINPCSAFVKTRSYTVLPHFLISLSKRILKMFLFYYKIGLIILTLIAKVMENQNFKCVYLRTMILCLQTYQKIWQSGTHQYRFPDTVLYYYEIARLK